MRFRHVWGGLLAACWLTACMGGVPGTPAGTATVSLRLQQVQALDPALGTYAAWVVAAGKPSSLGKFTVAAAGQAPTTLDGKPLDALVASFPAKAIDEVLITQEAPGAPGAQPSRQIFLRGMASNGAVTLAPPVPAERFAGKTCTYILDNPATEKDLEDANGVWFARLDGKVYSPGLTIDPAPAGFMYSAWAVVGGVPLRMGKFAQARENDDFYGYSGLNSVSLPVNFTGPPMPGEDFNAKLPAGVPAKPDLAGATLLIALESATLAGGEPFAQPLIIFRGQVPRPAAARTNYALENVAAATWPSGTATIQ